MRARETEPVPAHGSSIPVAAKTKPESDRQRRQRDQDAKKAEQDLVEMIIVLRRLLGNAAISRDWQHHMQTHGKAGWSRSAFIRRLRILKARGWIRIVGDTELLVDKVPEGLLIEATEKAPGAPEPSVPNQCHDRIDVGKAALEQLERLKRGKLSAA